MKATLIVKIVVMSVVAVFLIGVLAFGLTNGFGLNGLIQGKDADGDYKTEYTYTASPEDIDSLRIEWAGGVVNVRYYDGEEIKITETAKTKLKENDKLHLETSGSTVKISWNDKSWTRFLNFFNEGKKLVVELPRAMEMDEVRISTAGADITLGDMNAGEFRLESASGSIEVQNLRAETIRLNSVSGGIAGENLLAAEAGFELVSGDVEVAGLVAEKLNAKSVSGSVQVEGSMYEVKGESVSGSVTLVTGVMPTSGKLSSVSGSVTLGIPENDGFVLEHSSISGDLESGSFSIEKDGKVSYYKDKNAEAEIRLDTTSGGMSLEKVEGAGTVQSYKDWLTAEEERITAEKEARAAEEDSSGEE